MSPEPHSAGPATRRAGWAGALALVLAAGALLLIGLGDLSRRGDEGAYASWAWLCALGTANLRRQTRTSGTKASWARMSALHLLSPSFEWVQALPVARAGCRAV